MTNINRTLLINFSHASIDFSITGMAIDLRGLTSDDGESFADALKTFGRVISYLMGRVVAFRYTTEDHWPKIEIAEADIPGGARELALDLEKWAREAMGWGFASSR